MATKGSDNKQKKVLKEKLDKLYDKIYDGQDLNVILEMYERYVTFVEQRKMLPKSWYAWAQSKGFRKNVLDQIKEIDPMAEDPSLYTVS